MNKAKEKALQDIREELKRQNKHFLPFRSSLNTVMGKLVRKQIREQQRASKRPYPRPDKTNSVLVAHCFFSKCLVEFNDYSRYYDTEQK